MSFRHTVTICALIATWLATGAPAWSAGLSEYDRTLASKLSRDVLWPQSRNALVLSTHPLGIQTLSIEIDEKKKTNQSIHARVYQYHYINKQSRMILVDLQSEAVVSASVINSVHLPLSETEIDAARQWVSNDEAIMNKLQQELIRRAGMTLNGLTELDVKASIFEPDDKSHVCATERCALLSLFDKTNTVFSVEPVVNLQRQTVATLKALAKQ